MTHKTHTIAPLVNGVRHISDIEAFQCFNVEIDEQGHDLWGYRKIADKTLGKREVPKRDNLPHNPGSVERIEWLAEYYAEQVEGEEKSPFDEIG